MLRLLGRRRRRRERVLAALTGGKRRWTAAELARVTGIPHGAIYSTLASLEREGWIMSAWEGTEYPRQRVYFEVDG